MDLWVGLYIQELGKHLLMKDDDVDVIVVDEIVIVDGIVVDEMLLLMNYGCWCCRNTTVQSRIKQPLNFPCVQTLSDSLLLM